MDVNLEPQGQVAQTPAAPQGQAAPNATPQAEVTGAANVGQVEVKTPDKKPLDWDGDVNKLPPELQDWAKSVQRGFTKRSMAEAEVRRLGQEYQQLQTSEDWRKFQEWKAGVPNQQSAPTQQNDTQDFSRDWEEALLDGTGNKALSLIDKAVQKRIQEAAQMYGSELQQLRQTQQVTQFQSALSEFVDANPDALELHEMGIMQPIMETEFKNGRHQTYEQAFAASYEKASTIREQMRQKALQAAQGRVNEKREAIVQPGTTTGEASQFIVDSKHDVFEQAFNFALQNKKVKVKAKN